MGIEEFLLDRAEKKGMQKERLEIIKSLLRDTEFDDNKIASLAGIPSEEVTGIRKELRR